MEQLSTTSRKFSALCQYALLSKPSNWICCQECHFKHHCRQFHFIDTISSIHSNLNTCHVKFKIYTTKFSTTRVTQANCVQSLHSVLMMISLNHLCCKCKWFDLIIQICKVKSMCVLAELQFCTSWIFNVANLTCLTTCSKSIFFFFEHLKCLPWPRLYDKQEELEKTQVFA